MKVSNELQEQAINTLRVLSAEAITKANSGHPGLPMGTAAIAYTIWTRHLRHNPKNPNWMNRDRFILSGGHGSMLLYSLLHLSGYDLSLKDIKNFRQWGSKTPGHPEYGHTPGVEVTTGPLGQGLSNGVGFAIAEAHLAKRFNQPEYPIVDHTIFGIVTDGDLMEGVASEAASLAGHLQLGKIVYVYDDNKISIDGSTEIAFTEDRGARFEAYGWHVSYVEDGNDVEAIDAAIIAAKADPRPSLIVARTIIGYGMPNRAGTSKAHGEPPGAEELAGTKEKLSWPTDKEFYIPEDVMELYGQAINDGKTQEKEWEQLLASYKQEFPDLGNEFSRIQKGELPENWASEIPVFPTDEKGMASRAASGKVLNAIAKNLPDLIGGSADLAPSTKTWIEGSPAFQFETPEGRNFHFGVREHGMGAVINGMSLYPGVIPYGATFLVFSDYMRGSLRLSALSHYPSIWVFTHDSIGVGEDGPTHQPIEHLAALRTIPEMVTIRPADANETAEAWKIAIERRNGPTSLIFTRQGLPTIDREKYALASGVARGAYVLADLGEGEPEYILMASGSEVSLIMEAGIKLHEQGINVRLVSFPSWEIFELQDKNYQESVLPPVITKRLAVEAGISMGWQKYIGDKGAILGIDKYGASAPANEIFENYGFTVDNILNLINQIV
ncbi:MAG: transketolase [Chloroflexi bacterium]|jgi:transketolase|nr:transketolase [Chloroflexota bacterium]MBT3668941.1 transketolase [Chloroflexota bacterium]MBT4002797.1 transketolase [Chloroflexota bacterium]MBT4305332.1 transketolase [Chloroflexota bacterium]MBT4532478.1 transketolase [Chloroflexota bacterium]